MASDYNHLDDGPMSIRNTLAQSPAFSIVTDNQSPEALSQTQIEYVLVSRAHGGWVWGPFFVSGLYKFMGKLADRIFFGVQGPRGLGLGCRSLCLAFISSWENYSR